MIGCRIILRWMRLKLVSFRQFPVQQLPDPRLDFYGHASLIGGVVVFLLEIRMGACRKTKGARL